MNIEKLKQTTFEDYQRRLNSVLENVKKLENEPTGLYKRILNTDRMILYSCMGKIVNVSQSKSLNNRDELSFFESLNQLFNYYFYDDGELSIHWEKYQEGGFVICDESDENSKPVLDYYYDNDPNCKIAHEEDVHKLIDWHEKDREEYKKRLIEFWGEDEVKCFEKKDYIDYD